MRSIAIKDCIDCVVGQLDGLRSFVIREFAYCKVGKNILCSLAFKDFSISLHGRLILRRSIRMLGVTSIYRISFP